MDFFQGRVLEAAAGPWRVCGGHFDKVVPLLRPILKEEFGGKCWNVLYIKNTLLTF